MHFRWRQILTATCFATALALTAPASAAHAATELVSGTKSCGSGQVVYVRVTLATSAKAVFHQGNLKVHTAPAAADHFHKYSSRSVSWRVESSGNILSQSDGCMSAGGTF